ncbi:unnamed protein product [Chilo suppressalis]|uniref:Uncharacterized protein n=1 Tax=Chilo suppressalis TaxID=168631 RepID=A0ABN8B0Z8_CHISP|nr:unnamed protein product [Chilo suppressalis]
MQTLESPKLYSAKGKVHGLFSNLAGNETLLKLNRDASTSGEKMLWLFLLGDWGIQPLSTINYGMLGEHCSRSLESAQSQTKGARRQLPLHEHGDVLESQYCQQPGRKCRGLLATAELPPALVIIQHDIHRVHIPDSGGHLHLQPGTEAVAVSRLAREHHSNSDHDDCGCSLHHILLVGHQRILPQHQGRLRECHTHMRQGDLVRSFP